MDESSPKTPAIAIASGPHIFIYRNLRPYYKFTLPPLQIETLENETWNELKVKIITVSKVYCNSGGKNYRSNSK
jgi:Bardet-Biedl syndrome 1 protein